MKHIVYTPRGVCSRQMEIDVEEGKIVAVKIIGGCSGNTQGLSKLLVGMDVEDAIARLDGIKCGPRPTSCPDQMAQALKEALK